jgi:hypothetical protein
MQHVFVDIKHGPMQEFVCHHVNTRATWHETCLFASNEERNVADFYRSRLVCNRCLSIVTGVQGRRLSGLFQPIPASAEPLSPSLPTSAQQSGQEQQHHPALLFSTTKVDTADKVMLCSSGIAYLPGRLEVTAGIQDLDTQTHDWALSVFPHPSRSRLQFE